jgi:rhodanese-related sulfurtransferase
MKKIITFFALALSLLIFSACAAPAKAAATPAPTSAPAVEYQKITAADAKARMDSGDEIVILDVRTQEEYDAGHIPGAILIPNETIIDQQPELLPDLNAEILVYCRSGNRSAQAAKKLIAIGYTNVFDFGGIIDWPYDVVTD